MASKILVADDSLTIQKVISITLSSQHYDLVECHSETELLKNINEESYDLILLDFNLSEKISGYELAKEIKKSSPRSEIMVMLGTFDSVDEKSLENCGVGDKIVKPFESGKFIEKCKDLISRSKNVVEPVDNTFDEEVAAEESHSLVETDPETESESSSWDIRVPDVIETEEETNEIEQQALPEEDDLAYPEPKKIDSFTSSKMVSIDDLNEATINSFDEVTDPNYQLPTELSKSLEEEIAEESEDLWSPDDSETNIEFNAAAERSPSDNEINYTNPGTDYKSEIIERLKDGIIPQLNEVVAEYASNNIEPLIKDYLDQKLEEIIWKIVPDIAEKVILRELEDLKKSFLEDS